MYVEKHVMLLFYAMLIKTLGFLHK